MSRPVCAGVLYGPDRDLHSVTVKLTAVSLRRAVGLYSRGYGRNDARYRYRCLVSFQRSPAAWLVKRPYDCSLRFIPRYGHTVVQLYVPYNWQSATTVQQLQ